MMPIQQLLSRIRWDADFARGRFELGYFDRVEGRLILIPLQDVDFPPEDPRAFRLVDAAGRFHRVPFHRVREVHKDGQCIWRR
ncbi:MAG TPA: DUF504 domain-containing protein [Candidatus Acidoferrum sp.]|nr:DUF504 domain-containing protein [Candidatus Acidoferrum sp.]